MPKRVLVFGTFDILHPGHIHFLAAAGKFGSVTVALTPDALVAAYKGRLPVNSFSVRQRRLRAMAGIVAVVPADDTPNTYAIINKVQPDVIVLGYDQAGLRATIKKKLTATGLDVPIHTADPYRTDVYRSSRFRALAERVFEHAQ